MTKIIKKLIASYKKYDLDIRFVIEMLEVIDSNHTLAFWDNLWTYNKIKVWVKHELTPLEDIVKSFTFINGSYLREEDRFYKNEDFTFDYVEYHGKQIINEIEKSLGENND